MTPGRSLIRILVAAVVLLGAQAHAKDEYSFGVLNQRSPTVTAQFWNPILHYVTAKSGVVLKLKMGRTAQETYGMTTRGEFDFLYSNHIFTVDNHRVGYRVFARPEEKAVQGQLVVLDASPIRTLRDLEGKDVAFPNPSAFLGYYLPMDALLKAKVKVTTVFSVNQEGAMGQLKAGRVLAAGVNSEIMRDFADREKLAYRVLWGSGDFLGLPLASHPSVPAAHVTAVRDAFIKMARDPEGVKLLKASGDVVKQAPWTGFVTATDKDYNNVVQFYRNALVKGQ